MSERKEQYEKLILPKVQELAALCVSLKMPLLVSVEIEHWRSADGIETTCGVTIEPIDCIRSIEMALAADSLDPGRRLKLELRDSSPNGRLARVFGLGFELQTDEQVEERVRKSCRLKETQDPRPGRWVVRWDLRDADGERAIWERSVGDPGVPKLVWVSSRYQGAWKVGT